MSLEIYDNHVKEVKISEDLGSRAAVTSKMERFLIIVMAGSR